ncbi:hypothetical protein [Haloferula rosea]|uniref:Uncharacterized protein n=1 Tax=Haloferula rosea TaxID=490093 RepID=A0A934VFR6_9BACT|nr:hypothetical protein [Haloferula rosea]MBK1828634.1 hypothetical protein [Haloferula rosea]
MVPSFRPPLALAVLLTLAVPSLSAQSRAPWESFTHPTNADSWSVYNVSDDQYYFPIWDDVTEPTNPAIYFNFSGGQDFHFSTLGASNDAFSGNLAALKSGGVGFNLSAENANNINFVDVAFWSVPQARWYYSPSVTPAADSSWSWETFSFTDDTWYYYDAGWVAVELDDLTLSDVDEFIIRAVPNSSAADGEWVAIDDFVLFPQVIVPELEVATSGGSFHLSFDLLDGQSYLAQKATTGLRNSDFIDMPGALTENAGILSLSEPTSGSAFWRIDTDIDYYEIPQIPVP